MDWTLFIMAAGVLQGFLLSFILLKKARRNKKANRWLSAFILTFTLLSLSDVFERTIEFHRIGNIHFLFDWCILLLGPFMLTYVMEMTGERYNFKEGWFLHFIPAALLLLFFIPIYFISSEEKAIIILGEIKNHQNGSWDIFDLIIVAQIAVYFVWVFLILRKYSRCLQEHYSDLKHLNLRWLSILVGVSCGLFIVFILSIFAASNVTEVLNDIGFPVAAYIFGYFGFAQIDLSEVRSEINSPIPEHAFASTDSSVNHQIDRYVRSGLKNDIAEVLKNELDRFMLDEKPYLDNELNLRELAGQLEILPHHLSQLLNEHYGKNFFDFINSYRVQEVKSMLSNPNQNDESILSIAFSCGFNSKATFNSFFKKHTGQTPRQFRVHCGSQKIKSM